VVITDGVMIPTGYITWDFNASVPANLRVSNFQINKFLLSAIPTAYSRRQATAKEMDDGTVQGCPVHHYTGQIQESARPNCCILPTLGEMRDQFDSTHGGPYDWVAEPEAPERIPDAF